MSGLAEWRKPARMEKRVKAEGRYHVKAFHCVLLHVATNVATPKVCPKV